MSQRMDGGVKNVGLCKVLRDHIFNRTSGHTDLELPDEQAIVVDRGTGFEILGKRLAGLVIEWDALDLLALHRIERFPSTQCRV